MTPNQEAIMAVFTANPGMAFYAADLAAETGLTSGSVSKNLGVLRKAGTVDLDDGMWRSSDDQDEEPEEQEEEAGISASPFGRRLGTAHEVVAPRRNQRKAEWTIRDPRTGALRQVLVAITSNPLPDAKACPRCHEVKAITAFGERAMLDVHEDKHGHRVAVGAVIRAQSQCKVCRKAGRK